MRHPFGFVSGLILDVIVCPFSFTHVKRDHFGLRTSFRLSMLPLLARGVLSQWQATQGCPHLLHP